MKTRVVGCGMAVMIALLMGAANIALVAPAASAETAAAAEKSVEKKPVTYVGNSESKKYHTPSCEYAKKISKANRVQFASASEAAKAGYTPCKVCLRGDKQPSAKTGSTKGEPGKTEAKPSKSG